MTEHDPTTDDSDNRAERIRQLVCDCYRRRAAGESISDASLIALHPDLMPELAQQLANVRRLEVAQVQAEADETNAEFTTPKGERGSSSGLQIRCPHCHTSLEINADTPFSDITCIDCGSHFSLIAEETETRTAGTVTTVGHFELVEQLGVGGFGTVWKARDTQLNRTVAVKIPRKGQLQSAEVERFLREARTTAQLNHPNIVGVHEAGRDGDTVYIVTDFVRGVPLSDWLTGQQLSAGESAELCRKIAEALHHAHEMGVIHRDLKPHNIVIDGDREPQLTDFGLARREAGEVTVTLDGQILGTPAYMSPEQAQGEAHRADGRSDVYSLGVILFEVLTGELPFRGNVRMLIHQVVHEEAPSPRTLNGNVPRDLETICLKCLQKQPSKRYRTAAALADDLRRFTRGDTILARPTTRIKRGWRYVRRHPSRAIIVLVTVVALLALAALGGGYRYQKQLEVANSDLTVSLGKVRWFHYASDMSTAQRSLENGHLALAIGLLERHQPKPDQKDLRRFEWYYMWAACRRSIEAPQIDGEFVIDAQFSLDGQTLITVDQMLHRFNSVAVNTRQVVPLGVFQGWGYGQTVRLSDDGRFFADGPMIYSTNEGELFDLKPDRGTVTSVTFSSDAALLAMAEQGGSLTVWNLKTQEMQWSKDVAPEYRANSMAFSRDGRTLATGHTDRIARLWDVTTGVERCQFDMRDRCNSWAAVTTVAFSPDGRTLATGTDRDNGVLLWDVEKESFLRKLAPCGRSVERLDFSDDGKTLATAGDLIRLWDVEYGHLIDSFRSQSRTENSALCFSPDGSMLATGTVGEGYGVKLWQLDSPPQPRVITVPGVWRFAVSRDGVRLATLGAEEVVIWDVATGERFRDLPDAHGPGALSYDGHYLASKGDTDIDLWDVTTGECLRSLPYEGFVASIAFSPAADILAVTDGQGEVKRWDVVTGKKLPAISTHNGGVQALSMAFSPDGKLLANSGIDYDAFLSDGQASVKIVDTATREILEKIDDWMAMSTAFSSDGALLAYGTNLGQVVIWDVASEREVFRMHGHNHYVTCLAFLPNDQTLMSADAHTGTVKFWDVTTGQLRFELDAHDKGVDFLATTLDGRGLITGGDGTAKIWRAATEQEVHELRQLWKKVDPRQRQQKKNP